MDYMLKFKNRVLIYSSIFFGIYLFFAIIVILQILEIISMNITLMIYANVIYDMVLFLFVLIFMLYLGATINE